MESIDLATPPPELRQRWRDEAINSFPDDENPWTCDVDDVRDEYIATQAARWGADQELEACMEWMRSHFHGMPQWADELRSARRPKPPSLAKQGCDALDTYIYGNPNHKDKERTYNTIRAALDRLKELENNG